MCDIGSSAFRRVEEQVLLVGSISHTTPGIPPELLLWLSCASSRVCCREDANIIFGDTAVHDVVGRPAGNRGFGARWRSSDLLTRRYCGDDGSHAVSEGLY